MIRQAICPLRKELWVDVWDFNPDVLGSLLLKASATWGAIILAEGRHD
jgi:hypothetical protein